MILSAQTIQKLCQNNIGQEPLIIPFVERGVHTRTGLSFGLSQCGFDIRIAQDLIVYPISVTSLLLRKVGVARPSFALASSMEKFYIPNNIAAYVKDKSSLARIGLTIQNTILEPGWYGFVTIEITNHSQQKIKLFMGQPIAQVVFHQLDEPTIYPYKGKYNNQGNFPQPAIKEQLT